MTRSSAKMNPFPGLRPFTQEEDYLFFGREEQTMELLQRLSSNRFLAVVGTSGSGKSSLVRCGLLSQLLGGKLLGAGASWEIAVTHPGGNPLGLLTGALLDADLYDRDEEHARENLLATLSRSHFGLVEAVKQAGLGEGTNFLLVVDQFEEIFRFHEAGQTQQEAANEFVSLLLEAATQKVVPMYVVLTMRSDFIGECGQFEGLAEMVNRGEFLIPRLNREQYKRVIEGPIKVAGGQIAPRLLQRLLNDLGQQADQLPCLQHALMRTWNVWAGKGDTEALDLDDYQRVGRMSQALSLHADEIYQSLGSDRQRKLCQGLFQALTVEESNSRGIRSPQRLGRLCQILDVSADELVPIIDAYRQSGVTFLMPSPEVELTDQTIIDISHESLMRVWTRLWQWVEEETQASGIYRRLSESAMLFEQGKAGLYRDPELGIALAWRESKRPNATWAARYRPGFVPAMSFLDASLKASVTEEQAREAARQRELEQAQRLAEAQQLRLDQQHRAARKLRKLMAGVAGVAVIAGVACVFALVASNNAQVAQRATNNALEVVERQKAELDVSLKKAELAEENTKKALAESQIVVSDMRTYSGLTASERGQNGTAALWFASAVELLGADHPRSQHNSLRAGLWNCFVPRPAHAVMHPEEWVMGTSFHPSGQFLMTYSPKVGRFKGLCAIWDLSEEKQLQLPGHAGSPACGVWSHDGRVLALGTDRGHVLLQDFPDGQTIHDLSLEEHIDFLEIDPTGRYLAVVYGPRNETSTIGREQDLAAKRTVLTGDKVRVWDLQESTFVTPELKQPSSISNVMFHPQGTQLLVGIHGGYYLAFAVPSESNSAISPPLKMHQWGPSITVGERPPRPIYLDQGKRLLTIHPLQLWDTESWSPVSLARSPASVRTSINASAATPAGQIALGCTGGVALLDSRTLQIQHFLEGKPLQYVFDVAISPSGHQLLSGSGDRTARLYQLPSGTPIAPAIEHASSVLDVCWSRDGQSFATAQRGGLVRVWAMPTNPLPIAMIRPGGLASLSRSGRYVVSSGSTQRQSGPVMTRVYSTADGSPAGPDIRTQGPLLSAVFSPNEKEIAILAAVANSLSIVDWRTGELRATPLKMPSEPRSLRYHPDGELIGVLCEGGQIVLVNSADLSIKQTWSNQVAYLPSNSYTDNGALNFSPDGDSLITYETDAFVRVWDWKTSSLRYRIEGHRGRCTDIAHSSNGKLFATACQDNTVQLWDFATGKAVSNSLVHPDWVFSVQFHPQRDLIITSCRDAQVRIWNWQTGDLVCPPFQHDHEVHTAAFTPDGRFAVTASEDKTARVWEFLSGQPVTPPIPLSAAALNLEIAPDGRRMAIGGFPSGGYFHLVSLDGLFDSSPLDAHNRRLSAELIANQRVDRSGGLSNLPADQWYEAWKEIRLSRDAYAADLARHRSNVFAGAPIYPSAELEKRAEEAIRRLQSGLIAEAVAEVDDLVQNPNWSDVDWYNFACIYAIASSKILEKDREYSDRAMDMLRKAMAAGFNDIALIEKDTDLDPIRKREDFQKLMTELSESK